jgi:hypothetical protein
MSRKCIRERYSPMTPREKSCTPEKIAMIEARKGKPAGLPSTTARTTTQMSTAIPKAITEKPATLATCSGRTLKPVIMLRAWVISFRMVYPDCPARRGSRRTGTEPKRVVPQVSSTSTDTNGPE